MRMLFGGPAGGHAGKRELPERREALGRCAAVIFCAWFLAAGFVLIPYPGIQNDEALFASGLFQPVVLEHHLSVFKHAVPTMLMSYIGAVKIWLYSGIFWLWAPSVYSLRVPTLLIGAAAIGLSYMLIRRALGVAAAVVGIALLATDPSYLLTAVFDWGPVAIQHLMLAAGVLAILRFHQTGRKALLAAGFFAFGLGLWDKALFVWLLAGLTVAALAVYPRELFRHVTWRNLAIAAVAFGIGAAPLIRYNGSHRMATFRQNARYSLQDFKNKLLVLEASFDGHALLGYLAPDSPANPPGQPASRIENSSVRLSDATGGIWRGYGHWAAAVAILLLPFAGRLRRAGLFALVFCAIVWVQMALNQNTGGGTHHVVLMWPFPQLLIAAAVVGSASRVAVGSRRTRIAALAVTALVVWVCVFNVLVVNQHLTCFVRGGTTVLWTDAIQPLADELAREPGRDVRVLDWGMMDALRLVGRGALRMYFAADPFMDTDVTDAERAEIRDMLSDPNATFISHVAGKAVFTDVPANFDAALTAERYRKDAVRVIKDRMGRPIFEVFRVAAIPAQS